MRKKVYICAPLGGNVEENLYKVRRYTKYALLCGTAPVVPHFYAECLDDNVPEEREIGMAAGLSQAQLAAMVGVSRNTISSIETGQFNPTAKLALILCIALDKKFEELFYFDD